MRLTVIRDAVYMSLIINAIWTLLCFCSFVFLFSCGAMRRSALTRV